MANRSGIRVNTSDLIMGRAAEAQPQDTGQNIHTIATITFLTSITPHHLRLHNDCAAFRRVAGKLHVVSVNVSGVKCGVFSNSQCTSVREHRYAKCVYIESLQQGGGCIGMEANYLTDGFQLVARSVYIQPCELSNQGFVDIRAIALRAHAAHFSVP